MGRLLGDVHQWFHCWDLEPVVNHIDVHDFLFTEAGRGAGGDVDAAVAREKKKNISNYNKNWKTLYYIGLQHKAFM